MLAGCLADPIGRQDGAVAERLAEDVDQFHEVLGRGERDVQRGVIRSEMLCDALGVR